MSSRRERCCKLFTNVLREQATAPLSKTPSQCGATWQDIPSRAWRRRPSPALAARAASSEGAQAVAALHAFPPARQAQP